MAQRYIRAHTDRAAADDAPGTPIRVVASTEDVARDGMIVEAAGWQLDNFRNNPVVLWAHRYGEPPIGKCVRVEIADNKLIADIAFDQNDEQARKIESKYRNGYLNAVSVGFDVEEFAPPKGPMQAPRITKAELLEISAVPVPSDPGALAARQRMAEQAEVALDWQSVSADMVNLYLYPTARPIRQWRATYHTLARAYESFGKEPPERLSPDYLATLDSEAIAGLFLEGEAEAHQDQFTRHAAAQPRADLDPMTRSALEHARAALDAVLQRATPEPSTPEPSAVTETVDDATIRKLADIFGVRTHADDN